MPISTADSEPAAPLSPPPSTSDIELRRVNAQPPPGALVFLRCSCCQRPRSRTPLMLAPASFTKTTETTRSSATARTCNKTGDNTMKR
jgi:hypothetical protein